MIASGAPSEALSFVLIVVSILVVRYRHLDRCPDHCSRKIKTTIETMMRIDDDHDNDRDDDYPGPDCLISSSFLVQRSMEIHRRLGHNLQVVRWRVTGLRDPGRGGPVMCGIFCKFPHGLGDNAEIYLWNPEREIKEKD